ncbi:NAD(P)H-dependent oxidoreductase [Chryseobacterium sp. Ch-15]|uniref:NAD(P)H-dependent oxidoreductase n=1 Tax=Chryseobacterium muglaense TaxID=2893752 RepID=A0A9Q3V0J9_9FLAO|nr:NAD(P)H-dependent oxidoreductase [Chryseobacterium muglaense]MBD3907235.1 NAD(P)H-dependent oxidoreductase [Chryseobacterium muglaense]MCC9036335.1 NAD(P)H-dependent oxidoreductase [Chryseobacterium muglaense]MCM2556430.1 NAD(P)H-dependent oxidoreductase [Chryseobacterium muglaense]
MKTLIIVIHPKMQESLINKRWVEELHKSPEKYTVHQLYKNYPDEIIDVKKEQELIEAYDKIIFQFPFYWFSSPPLLKKWLDEVLLHGWAYGSKSGFKVGGKKIALAISVGVDDEDYSAEGKYKYTMTELLRPFELTFEYIKADYRDSFVYYGMEHNPSPEWIEKSVSPYLDFIDKL